MPSHVSADAAASLPRGGQGPLTTTSTVRELTRLLHQHGDRILEGKALLSLTTESLAVLNNGFDAIRESPEDKSFDVLPTNHSPLTVLPELQIIHDFVQKTPSLRLAHGNNTIQGCINLQTFRALKHLELRRVPMHLLHGLQRVRQQLVVLSVERCLHQLQDVFESMPPDETAPSLSWSSLEKAYLPYNFIEHLDGSLRLLPALKVLDMSHNSLKTSDDYLAYLTELVHLNLSYNFLSTVPSLSMSSRTRLRTLVLANNHVDNLSGLEGLEALEILDVSNNLLCDHADLSPLSRLVLLKELYLALNPLTFHKKHRSRTAAFLAPAALRSVRLDGVPFTASELTQARTMVGVVRRPLSIGRRSLVNGSQVNLLANDAADSHYGSIAGYGAADRDALDSLTVSMQSRNSVRRIRSIQISDLDETGDGEGLDDPTNVSGSVERDLESAAAVARSARSAAVQNDIANARREMEELRRQLGDTWLTSLVVTSTPTPRPKAAETATPALAAATASTSNSRSDRPREFQTPTSVANAASSFTGHSQQLPQMQPYSVQQSEKPAAVAAAVAAAAAAATTAGTTAVASAPQPVAFSRPLLSPSSSAFSSPVVSFGETSQSVPNRLVGSAGTLLVLTGGARSLASAKAPIASLLAQSPATGICAADISFAPMRPTLAHGNVADAGIVVTPCGTDVERPSCNPSVARGSCRSSSDGAGDFADNSLPAATSVAPCGTTNSPAVAMSAISEPRCCTSNQAESARPTVSGEHSAGHDEEDGEANLVWKDVVEDEDAESAGDELFIVYPVHTRPASSGSAASVPILSAEPCFVLLGGHYLFEKDHNGHVSDKLDLRMLLSANIASEVSKDSPIVNLQFDYVRKDRRERSYAMENMQSAEHLMALLSPVLKLRQESAAIASGHQLQCLRCSHVFKKEEAILKVRHKAAGSVTKATSVSEVLHCPSCSSPQVVRHEADNAVDECAAAAANTGSASLPGHRRTGSVGSLLPTATPSATPANGSSSLLPFDPAATSSRLTTPERPLVAALGSVGGNSSGRTLHAASLKRRLAASAGGTPLYGSLCNVSESTSYYSVMDDGAVGSSALGSAAASSFHSVEDLVTRLRSATDPRRGSGGTSGLSSGCGSQETITSTEPDAGRAVYSSPRSTTPEVEPRHGHTPTGFGGINSQSAYESATRELSGPISGNSGTVGSGITAAADGKDDTVVVEPYSQLTFRFDDFTAVDHRLKLFLAMAHFADDEETCECVLLSHVVQHNTALHFVGILAVSTVAVYVLKIRRHHSRLSPNSGSGLAKAASEQDVASSVVLVERQPLVDLCYVDIALRHQNFRLEFERSGYCFLVRDEQRSKKFITLLTAVVRRVAFDASCRLSAITKLHGEYLECFNKWVRTDDDIDASDSTAGAAAAAEMDMEHATGEAIEPYYCMALLCGSDSASMAAAPCSHPYADSSSADSLEPVSLFLTGNVIYVLKENCCLPLSRCSSESVKKSYFSLLFTLKISDVSQVNLLIDFPRYVELEMFKEVASSVDLPLQNQRRLMFATVQAARAFVEELSARWRVMFGVELSVEFRAL